jgi:MraZ protein
LAFHGTFEHSLDAKNRLTVPAKFRGALSEGVYLVRSADDPCVQVYPSAAYASMAEQAVAGMNPMSRQAKEMRRLMFSFADDVPLDGAGRITLTPRHLQHAGIDGREVVITGRGDALELWGPKGWDDYERGLMARAADLTGSLDHSA